MLALCRNEDNFFLNSNDAFIPEEDICIRSYGVAENIASIVLYPTIGDKK
ncbi:MAG: hypothetical protein H3C36_14215 [Chitinophagaceae bacterium]|nr:hypothetical protein [Chitinophagaceae bacterium]MCZ2395223.1 hypothetical protein [Chitinophagales bacterium]